MKTNKRKPLAEYLKKCPCGNPSVDVNCLAGRCARCKKIEEAMYPQRKSFSMKLANRS